MAKVSANRDMETPRHRGTTAQRQTGVEMQSMQRHKRPRECSSRATARAAKGRPGKGPATCLPCDVCGGCGAAAFGVAEGAIIVEHQPALVLSDEIIPT